MKNSHLSFYCFCLYGRYKHKLLVKRSVQNRYLSANNYYAYPTPTAKQTAAPKGYEPFISAHICVMVHGI